MYYKSHTDSSSAQLMILMVMQQLLCYQIAIYISNTVCIGIHNNSYI